MQSHSNQRSNDAWIAALRSPGDDGAEAAQDLAVYLRRMLGRIARGRCNTTDLEELVQESLARVLENLASFRGDSAFTTWATAVATRVVFTWLRRQKVHRSGRDEFADVQQDVAQLASPHRGSESALSRDELLQALERAIATKLTERQRLAIVAELRGVPTIEIAERMGTNQNALYKLTHDARQKLRAALLADGFTSESLYELAAGGEA